MLRPMAVARELDDITRSLVRHRHEHPPVRDVNQEHDRRLKAGDRIAGDFARVVGSWTFVIFQGVLLVIWILLNALGFTRHWDGYPFQLLNLILSFEAAFGMPLVLMALNRVSARSRLSAQQAYEEGVKSEEEVKSVMTHLEVQDEVMLQVLHRLERFDRELRKISRRLGVAEEPA
ncbi:MAG: DUF1003 domain-containing protein [Chloroflexi bacterium]|nr:MAG: DUF1003 domain-containing protein [Chloroflexota bacterium]TME14751.1 MAG: DUF1003 domain-containing protein [Chloroflexota bacterium]TME18570.1 MAG: DUF1003 domain-containing protein [Chloroflexota bacterium]